MGTGSRTGIAGAGQPHGSERGSGEALVRDPASRQAGRKTPFDSATIVVLLEGPQPISEQAFEVGHAVRAWGATLDAFASAVLNQEAGKDEKDEEEQQVSLIAGEVVGTFIDMARKHLDRA
ncbi:hypothetical protein [Streptomyces albidus (ex Kaewkla and Franco 2022)]|uniref:hypothetical protein n=1 Tax=Streptomyces albidus (ex Kaewkla and Franco 2022) TaxID=722709 RepID=UPI0015EE940E|nr:hypothetical protein [Streptomyces albidus (ex Kaewkla and Franco 2022)]